MLGKLVKLLSQKAAITVFSLLLQIAIIVVGVLYLASQFWWIWLVLEFCSFLICLYIVSRDMNPSYKLIWCVIILLAPAFGGLVYLLIGRQHTPRRVRKKLKSASDISQVLLNMTNAELLEKRGVINPTGTTCADLVLNAGSYPVYGNTHVEYFSLGDDMFPKMLADIRAAKKFVLMEYFIYDRGELWDELEAALIDRARNGVDVKLLYDDVGSMFTLPKKGIKRLRASGVEVKPFNKITFSFDMRLNNRSHRKITVVDGEIAYTGGNNIADEYANKKVRFGHWKDTHVRITGAAVWSFTAMFLSFWHIISRSTVDYYQYLTPPHMPSCDEVCSGYVQPLSSGPGRDDHLIESAFINLISTAKRYVYITTPYLILDNEMQTALVNAALSGIDVRIVIPNIPDKKAVYQTTKSFVPVLVKAGVKVYRYSPGFIHAKMMIVDDERAFIGTCNMDYRSFYLHYECGALLYNVGAIADMKRDFDRTVSVSREMTHDEVSDVTLATRLVRSVLRLIAPMM